MKKFLLFMLGVLIALPGIARDFKYEYEGQTLTYTVIDEEAKTCETKAGYSYDFRIFYPGNDVSGDLMIPSVAKDGDVEYTVTEIGANAFCNCSGLTSVFIPNSVTSIGKDAFDGCDNLNKLAYPSGLSSQYLFVSAGDIQYPREEAIIEDGIVYGPEKNAIYFVPVSLKGEYVIPNSVTSIGKSAFRCCSGLTSVTIPNSVTSIGNRAFELCSGLTSVTIPNSVTIIGDFAFYDCSGIKTFTIEDGQSGITFGRNALFKSPIEHLYIGRNWSWQSPSYFPTSIKSVEISNYVTELPDHTFNECSGLTSVIIPNSVTIIGDFAFYDCSGLTSVTIPNSVTTIGGNAFSKCSGLTSVVIPNSVTSIGNSAFSYCYGINTFTIEDGQSGITFGTDVFYASSIEHLYIGRDWSWQSYGHFPTSIKSVEISNYVTELPDNVFSNCSGLTSVIIPNSVTSIGESAFYRCSGLTSVVIPNSVTTIGESAFRYCSGLTSVVIPNSVTTIGESAFRYCSGLTSVVIGNSVTSIGIDAFDGCNNLIKSAYPSGLSKPFSSGVRIIYPGDGAIIEDGFVFGPEKSAIYFAPLSLEGEYVIPASVNAIKDYAFYYNSILKSVTFNEALQSIGSYAFKGCSNLQAITFNEALQSIGDETFSDCTGLTTVVIPGNVTAIGARAFLGSNVRDLTFAYGAEQIEIGYNAFPAITSLSCDRPLKGLNLDCSSLKSLTIGNSVTKIPTSKFEGATHLSNLTLGNSLTDIGYFAFSGCSALTKVILPPSVKTIDNKAFFNNGMLNSIIIGHNVTTIGEEAFGSCPNARTFCIAAQTPPSASDNTFSYYDGTVLYVQGNEAANAYSNADKCWYKFSKINLMIEPTEFKVEGDKTLNGKPGDTFQLTATLYPTDVTLPQVFWRSTNPDIATVDANGLVTLHADMSDIMAMAEGDDDTATRSCKIIAESLYANGPVAEFTVNDTTTGIEDVINDSTPSGEIDFTAPVEVYSLQGVMVSDNIKNLTAGIYIVRQGNIVKKIAVK